MKFIASCSAALLALSVSTQLYAQEIEPINSGDETMVIIDDDMLVDDVVNRIELPTSASPQAVESAAFGLGTANSAREDGRAFGQRQAADARARGADARDNARSAAQEAGRTSREETRGSVPGGIGRP